MRHLQRRWRLLPAGDRAWQRLTLAADRAGVGPRPSETIYEYAGWLEEQLPSHVEPIRTVADGKVWQAYSGRRMTQIASSRLEEAWARLRLPLVWLAVRRTAAQRFRPPPPLAQRASGRPSISSTWVAVVPSRWRVSFQRSSRHRSSRAEQTLSDALSMSMLHGAVVLVAIRTRAMIRSVPPWLTTHTGHAAGAVLQLREQRP